MQKELPESKPGEVETSNPPQNQITALVNLYHSGQLIKSEQACRELLRIYPQSLVIMNVLGAALSGQSKLKESIQVLDKVIQLKPDYAEAFTNRGITLKKLGQLDAAVKSYERALAIKPDYAEVHSNLGLTLHDLGQLDAAVKSYQKALSINPDLAQAHSNLGLAFHDLSQLDAAVKSYEKALMINPGYAKAHNNLGNTLKELGQLDAAVKSYERALKLNPKDHSSRHLLNSILGQTSQSAPNEYIESLFNNYAYKFDDRLVNKLEYTMPSLLRKAFLDSGLANNKICKTIDLGCGTGLSGAEFRDLTETLIGIDISDKMIAKAEEKNIYDELYVNDLISGLKKLGGKFDLFVSSDVFVYVGDLGALFKAIKEHATKNSLFIFSTEDEGGDSFHLQKSGRFSHSKSYITQLASTLGFQLICFEKSNLRKEKEQWIIGGIYILKSI